MRMLTPSEILAEDDDGIYATVYPSDWIQGRMVDERKIEERARVDFGTQEMHKRENNRGRTFSTGDLFVYTWKGEDYLIRFENGRSGGREIVHSNNPIERND